MHKVEAAETGFPKGRSVDNMQGAFAAKEYRNLFAQCGYSQEDIDRKVEEAFQTIFYGPEDQRFYHPAGEDMGYLEDTGNHDARTEGMSYGMMMCVQMDRKEEFDRIWKWAKTYMYMTEGENAGYFAWSCQTDGTKNAWGAAPDGEEYFAMALFFASHRWGDGEGIFAYSQEARKLLHDCVHKGEAPGTGRAMWDPENKLIRFVAEQDFSDPSYHLPHFYQLFALWADEEDRPFWEAAAKASREYLHKACHPKTGLCAEYAAFDGAPQVTPPGQYGGRHDWFYSDAYRTAANIGLDYAWFAADEGQRAIAANIQRFFSEGQKGSTEGVFLIDGTPVPGWKALHPVGLLATLAEASLASDGPYAQEWVRRFWETPLRQGDRRYYDNCLYFFALLALSGKYRIW